MHSIYSISNQSSCVDDLFIKDREGPKRQLSGALVSMTKALLESCFPAHDAGVRGSGVGSWC